jgi:hypothetical protein
MLKASNNFWLSLVSGLVVITMLTVWFGPTGFAKEREIEVKPNDLPLVIPGPTVALKSKKRYYKPIIPPPAPIPSFIIEAANSPDAGVGKRIPEKPFPKQGKDCKIVPLLSGGKVRVCE